MEENKIDALMNAVVVEANLLCNSTWRAMINLFDDIVEIDPHSDSVPKDCRTTCGIYGLKYLPATDIKRNKNYPYVFINDMLPMRICVKNMKHLAALSSNIPEIAWILRNSNFSPKLFYWAVRHPGLKIPFSVNFAEYCDKVADKAKSKGIDVESNEFRPLVNCVMNKVRLKELFGNKKEWVVKSTAYSKEIKKQMSNHLKENEL